MPLKEKQGTNIQFLAVSGLYIENNTFENKKAGSSDNYIRLYNTESNVLMKNLNIKNNKFTNINPKKRYIYLQKFGDAKIFKNVTSTNNNIRTSNKKIPFVQSSFDTTGMNIKSNIVTKVSK